MISGELRQKFLDFFESRRHKIVPSSSLIPTDPSVLFTTAGMQQFKPYFLGEKSPWGENAASCQKCVRTSDIDEVGDERHLTFFEMLGNFSFGGYFKKEAIEYAKEFLESIGLKIEYVTVFAGDEKTPFDEESYNLWKNLGLKDIRKAGREDNFWGPTGTEGPCGPTTEIYINGIEMWNIVFNEYFCDKNGKLTPLPQKGVDTGMGLERLAILVQDKKNVFETDLFSPIIRKIRKDLPEKIKRVIADHARAIVFLVSDGIAPSNKEQGYVLRRLIRRIIAYAYQERIQTPLEEILETVVNEYKNIYPNLDYNITKQIYDLEHSKFIKSVGIGLKELDRLELVDAQSAFKLYESFGLPYETIKDVAGIKAAGLDRASFKEEFNKHQAISRAGVEKKFGGHGLVLNTGEARAANEEELKIVIRLHTATHLLQAALRKILGPEVRQKGSDITAERLRFDFTFRRKLTSEELAAVEKLVQEKIDANLKVEMRQMPFEEALKESALTVPGSGYPEKVKVYSVNRFSKEVCGGPHVQNTGEIGRFKIIKEEAIAMGVRRIRATID